MLYPGLIIDKTYQVCNEIGSGGMGVVYLAFHLRLNKYVVLKRLKNAEADFSSLRNEVDVLKSLRHSLLPQVYDFIEFDRDLYAVIDYIEGYDLKYYIDNHIEVSESQLIKWLSQLCQVLEYMHRHNPRVLHLDIKPANIIIQTNGDICLIDFGISMLGNGRLRGLSYEYSSPEQNYNASLLKQGCTDGLIELDERTDIYSLGATFYELITGVKPSCLVQMEPVEQQYAQIAVSQPLAKIIDKAVSYQRENRYSDASEMLRAIENMFKLSDKYKLYLLAQIASSVLACLLIILGAVLIYDGTVENIRISFERDYSAYIAALQSNDNNTAIFRAKELINSSDYRSLIDADLSAEIYHSMGDCYFDEGDYLNASTCYEKAISALEGEEKADIYYRDYALSLIEQEHTAEARTVLSKLTAAYPNSPASTLVAAQLAFQDKDYSEAESQATQALSASTGSEHRYSALMLLGDIASQRGDDETAVKNYTSAKEEKQTARIFRKLGTAHLKLGAKDHSANHYREALFAFRALNENFTATENDVFNLAQCYMLSGVPNGAETALETLKSYVSEHSDSCRSYIMLAIAADSVGDKNAGEYCRKAHTLYLGLSDEEREKIDQESLSRIKTLYSKYFGEEW